jgi:DNA invertase Pin-like site-specific DNA recombinase
MRTSAKPKELPRTEVRDILFRHKGSVREVARDLDVSTQAIYLYLRDATTSEKIAKAVQVKASELLKMEKRNAA